MTENKLDVVISGAGPNGLLVACELALAGVRPVVLERLSAPSDEPKANGMIGQVIRLLDMRGLYRTFSGSDEPPKPMYEWMFSGMRVRLFGMPDNPMYGLPMQQPRLVRLLHQRARELGVDVRWGHELTGARIATDGITVHVSSSDGEYALETAYLIGADGGRSTVRKLAGIEFEGFTYPEKFIKIATTFDFAEVNPDLVFRNYFSDPDEWCNLFKVRGESPGGLWRAIFPLRSDEDDAEALAPDKIESRLQKFFPKAGRYHVEYVNVYPVSQCVAATMRSGRILLAGDAAHVNNPIGGMGMNGGIHDAINLADKLARVLHGEAGEDLLDLFSRQRRHAAVKYVQQQTIANKRLMEERDPKVRAKNFDELRRIAEDPEASRKYMRRAALLDSLNEANAVT
jgi:3-(3-hydroxy-phenyl)propionate hydroxylase